MRKYLILLFILLPFAGIAQYKWDFGGQLGAANYLGDIGGGAGTAKPFIFDLKLSKTRPCFGGYARKKIKPWLYVRANVSYGRISGADSLSLNPARKGRNLSFVNNIIEGSLITEFVLFKANDVGNLGTKRLDFRAYAFTGVGVFHHDPKASYQGQMVKLQPLETEGKKYSTMGVCIPYGVGIDYTIGRRIRIGLEMGARKTFTDYLDDVSGKYPNQPGTPTVTNPMSLALSNRHGEIPNVQQKEKDGTVAGYGNYGVTPDPDFINGRGSKKKNTDSYLYLTVNAGYVLKGKSSFYKSKYNYLTGVKRKFKRRRVRAKF